MSKNNNLTELLLDVADAIRSKKGTSEAINPQDFSTEIASIEGGEGGYTIEDIASASIKGDLSFSIRAINAYSFYGNSGITSISAPNVTAIGNYAFSGCTSITEINLPIVITIGDYAFNTQLLTSLNLPECTSIGAQGIAKNPKLSIINLPKVKTIGGSVLTYISAQKLVLPECTSIGNSSLTNCPNLTYVDLPKCTSIVNYGLRNNAKLETLIMRSPTMATLSNYALNSTAIANKKGYIYVPSALVDSYMAATNWSKMSTQFRALEDYTIDGTINGELDESKI